jgi:hypothetical protein
MKSSEPKELEANGSNDDDEVFDLDGVDKLRYENDIKFK